MKILVTGGAGYIGSFMTKTLLDKGFEVVVLDSLERGNKEALDSRAQFIQGDTNNTELLNDLFSMNSIQAVMHFAGYISVEESTKNPELYYKNNIRGSENLFKTAIRTGNVTKFIFSSTAAIYGNPKTIPIPENHEKHPESPYGKTKLETEAMLQRLRAENKISFTCLRYFNAAGAALDGSMGEAHVPETHLIPLAIRAALLNTEFKLFGTDYDTPDGTCVRDYIHVLDLVSAHLLSLKKLEDSPGEYFYNVGTGSGYSNKEVISMVETVSGKKVNVVYENRRSGDAGTLIADVTKIKNELHFNPHYSNLETIISSAWKWHTRNTESSGQKQI